MSLKPVELQIAVPRATEAGKLQNDLQHRPSLNQQQLAGQNVKSSHELTQRSSGVDETAETSVRDDGQHDHGSGGNSSPGKKDESTKYRDAEHPYKGHSIDLTL
ncbi:hypothetical protein [Paenibacillus wynnii]|uniref:hypothetical protein n=1 Tax=Paenibacillus wynnii TaxID=268407 RepID=UPI002793C80A|nr:hypothetical protein [Paenibacillus wynnii]MDQ0193463.1 hypothetical protein [Paenibacillus wynnii]